MTRFSHARKVSRSDLSNTEIGSSYYRSNFVHSYRYPPRRFRVPRSRRVQSCAEYLGAVPVCHLSAVNLPLQRWAFVISSTFNQFVCDVHGPGLCFRMPGPRWTCHAGQYVLFGASCRAVPGACVIRSGRRVFRLTAPVISTRKDFRPSSSSDKESKKMVDPA